MKETRVIISGGGTGGHIFPAVSIANAIKEIRPDARILFVGAEGRMEMQRVPAAGYEIKGLPVSGLIRPLWSLRNVGVLLDFLKSKRMVRNTIREFKPQVAVGVGGYASAATLNAAYEMGIPCLIQEQNSFAGLTNKTLARKARKICVAYEGMERFFPKEKLVMSGNPIREAVSQPATAAMKAEAMKYYKLDPQKKHLFVVGGSLGSGTLNNAMKHWIQDGCPDGADVEVIWQCGKYYKKSVDQFMAGHQDIQGITPYDFIARMDLAYAAADVVISRSGASTVSELCAMGKATVFVPSPNVAEDHQTHNAMALVRREAALLVKDSEAVDELLSTAIGLLHNDKRRAQLEKNAEGMALRNAAQIICDEVYKLV